METIKRTITLDITSDKDSYNIKVTSDVGLTELVIFYLSKAINDMSEDLAAEKINDISSIVPQGNA